MLAHSSVWIDESTTISSSEESVVGISERLHELKEEEIFYKKRQSINDAMLSELTKHLESKRI